MAVPKSFIDEATITVKAGDGGHGLTSFLREKYRPKGGPAGGDGGKGGDVYLKVVTNMVTLQEFRHTRHFKAERGINGQKKNMAGRKGKDLIVPVPPGTLVTDADTGELVADMSRVGMKVLVAEGGAGGLGNQHFATSRNRAPTKSTEGKLGVARTLHFELRLLGDVGLVGFPNAGKSTFLNRISNAKPRIASYPFTTLRPSVGIVKVGDFHLFSMADIPGIIEDAHTGKGLGIQFLRHIARTTILCHLVELRAEHAGDISSLVDEYRVILGELEAYGEGLSEKERVTVLNKVDVFDDPETIERVRQDFIATSGCTTRVYCTSTESGSGLKQLVLDLMELVQGDAEDPHAGLEIRYELPDPHLNIRHTTDADAWWTQVPGQEDPNADEDDADAFIETREGEMIPLKGPQGGG